MDALIRAAVASICVAFAACVPTLEDETSIVTSPRVLAVRAEPAEAATGQDVTFTALYADASGSLAEGPLTWTLCGARRPLDELGPVAAACYDLAAEQQTRIGEGLVATARIPMSACRDFGPNPPLPMPGQPPGRPVDPDTTGGYYQPITIFGADPVRDLTLVRQRIACGVADAPTEQNIAFNRRYRRNANPAIAQVSYTHDGSTSVLPADGSEPPPVVTPGASIALSISWPVCPVDGVCGDGICGDDEDAAGCPSDCATPVGCGGAETYVVFDTSRSEVVRVRESMRVVFFVSGGSIVEPRLGRDAVDDETSVSSTLTVREDVGDVVVWAVLTDARGGSTFEAYRLRVE